MIQWKHGWGHIFPNTIEGAMEDLATLPFLKFIHLPLCPISLSRNAVRNVVRSGFPSLKSVSSNHGKLDFITEADKAVRAAAVVSNSDFLSSRHASLFGCLQTLDLDVSRLDSDNFDAAARLLSLRTLVLRVHNDDAVNLNDASVLSNLHTLSIASASFSGKLRSLRGLQGTLTSLALMHLRKIRSERRNSLFRIQNHAMSIGSMSDLQGFSKLKVLDLNLCKKNKIANDVQSIGRGGFLSLVHLGYQGKEWNADQDHNPAGQMGLISFLGGLS